MNMMKTVIIGLAVSLAAVVGYTIYLYQGPLKQVAGENKNLLAEIEQMKAASTDRVAAHEAERDAGIHREKELETQVKTLEETVAQVSKDKQMVELELEKLIAQFRKEEVNNETKLQSKVDDLKNQLVQKQQELQTSQKEIEQLQASLEKIRANHDTRLTEKIRLVVDLQRRSRKLGEVVARARNETRTIEAELRHTIKNLEAQLVQRELELQASRSEALEPKIISEETEAAYKAELAEKIRVVENLQRKSTELEKTIPQIKADTETLAADLESMITGLENQLAQWNRELQTSRNELHKLRSTIASLENAKKMLSDKLKISDRQLLLSKNKIEELQKKIADGEIQFAKAAEKHQALTKKIGELQEEGAQLTQNKINLENQLAQSRDQLLTVSQEVSEKIQENLALKKQMDSTKEERDQLNEAKNTLENQLAELRRRFQTITDDSAAKDRKIAEIEKNRQSLLVQIENQKMEKEELERLKNALKNQLGMTQSQIEELSMESAAKENQLKTKEKQLKSMELAYQELSRQLERQIKEKDIQISNLRDKLNIRLLDKILFASGSADVTSIGYRVLESLASELKKMYGFEIAVAGHTDNMPLGPKIKEAYYDNLGLSVARAAAVSRALSKMGVSPDNLSAVGYSEYHPIAANDTKEGRQQNRRVEIMLEPRR